MTCIEGNRDIFKQIKETLSQLSPEEYGRGLDIFEGTSIGKHFRHIFDFYHCIEKSLGTGRLDYCQRERHPLIETDPAFAAEAFQHCFEALSKADDTKKLTVKADFSTEEIERPVVESSVGREMMYAFDHAVHHLAIVKIGIKACFPEISIDKNLGVAPSTQKHEKTAVSPH